MIVFIMLILTALCHPAAAIESTYYTYSMSLNNESYIRVQDAYIPGGVYLQEIGMNTPEDLYYHDRNIYIADTGNGRIVRYDMASGAVYFLGEGDLKAPTGLAVADDGRIIIADYGAGMIIVMSLDGKVLQRIGRPEEVFYGKSAYKPRKVGIDSYGNILALSEGTHEGILQFMPDGTFAGFFGANHTKGLNLVEWVQKTFYTEEQKAGLFFRTPPSIASLHVSENSIFTVTANDWRYSIKKLNLAGVDILPMSGKVIGENNFVDLTVAPNGSIIAVTDTGSIEEFDSDGYLLLMFGGRAVSSDRNGLTTVVSAVDIDDEYTIYTLDKERALIQTYIPTRFADTLHQAGVDYAAGDYMKSLEGWEEILRMNPMASMSHWGYANTLFQLGDYRLAAYHFKLNGDYEQYSKCFWEIRSAWMRANMYFILLAVIGAAVLLYIYKLVSKSGSILAPALAGWGEAKRKHRLLRDIASTPFYMMRHPVDCLYDLKRRIRGSTAGATILYLLALIVCFADRMYSSFIFGGGVGWWVDPVMMLLTTTVPAALFWTGSYLVSSINNGEGRIMQTYTAFGYALSPYIVFTPMLTILSHALTFREEFIFKFLCFLVIGYTCVLIFLSVKETYSYNIKQTVSNILLTAGFMLIAALAMIILFILWRQLLSFLSELFEEARYRVFR